MASAKDEDGQPSQLDHLLDDPGLADALEGDRFRQFLDHLPIAIAVAELQPEEHIVYANPELLKLLGEGADWPAGRDWTVLAGSSCDADGIPLGQAVTQSSDFVGRFAIPHRGQVVNAWSNLIHDDDGAALFRLVALIEAGDDDEREQFEQRLREKDTLLREIQHRVKNNLQMITALIRLESRQSPDGQDGSAFDRLAGRIEALALLYAARDNRRRPAIRESALAKVTVGNS